MPIILVPGTHGWRGRPDDFHHPDSPFVKCIEAHGHTLLDKERPYVWSTDLGGIGFGRGDLVVWHAAGINLYQYLVPPRCPDDRVPPSETVIISHSHGLNPVLFACRQGLQVRLLIDIAAPVRKDMMDVAEEALPNITHWIHLAGGRKDKMQWLGSLFDGHWGIRREHPLAHENIIDKSADHGSFIRDPKFFGVICDLLQKNLDK